ncbi:antibiotic biosynthesis monooxygenase [Frankia sp. AgB1.9]|nr:antibiotic biosynthesis monooxygenase [Frankia sp. AgW1.1]MBL7550260.1 antibiotic biosynthesis monooxygenase [Frankia sp. AgB1.9]MBL7623053.1 antibiotic biosynthesis monooxygenase [Frankia sp. AgB1.8]
MTEGTGAGRPAADLPFRVMLTMHVHPGLEADFERTWLEIGDQITSHPANLGQWLVRSADEPSTYYIMSDWVNERLFRAFEQTPGHLEHRKILHPLRASGSMVTGARLAFLPGAASVTAPGATAEPAAVAAGSAASVTA